MKIRFDGWDESYDQWADYRSPDVFPTGWCEAVGYHLTAPANQTTPVQTPSTPSAGGGGKKKASGSAPGQKGKGTQA